MIARVAYAAVVSAFLLSLAAPAAAQKEELTEYERDTVRFALKRHGAKIDPNPEGKRIVDIEIDVLEVFDADLDPSWLTWANVFHATSKDYVIRRELLFKQGQAFTTKKIRESERNIRGIRQESLVLIVPLLADAPDEVRILVIAKDIWSLRLNSNYRVQNGQLELLLLQPAEENLAGTHRRILGNFLYEPDTITAGAAFVDPRLAGTRHTWSLAADVIVNHSTGDLEGGSGAFTFGRPLFSLSTPWSWGAGASYSRAVTREFFGLTQRQFDGETTPEDDDTDLIPIVYNSESVGGTFSVTRSFGYYVKNNFRMGFTLNRTQFRSRPEVLQGKDRQAVERFEEEIIPFGETRNGPFIQYNVFLNDYLSISDAETMGLQENYQLGPQVSLRFQPISRAFGSTRDVLNYSASASYTHAVGKGYVRADLGADLETQLVDAEARVTDSGLSMGFRAVTPPFYVGRLIYDGIWLVRPDNFSNAASRLGGDGRLRGYPSLLYRGENFVASNVEFRTRSFLLWSVLVRGALFYDIGDAYDDELDPKHGAGFGLRVLFPQLGRKVMRLDWGFALSRDAIRDHVRQTQVPWSPFQGFVLTFGQVFDP